MEYLHKKRLNKVYYQYYIPASYDLVIVNYFIRFPNGRDNGDNVFWV